MDTSNPVISSDRRTLEEVWEMARAKRKQNLAYIQELARSADRVALDVEGALDAASTKTLVMNYRENLYQPPKEGLDLINLKEGFESQGECPVTGLLRPDRTPIHPPGINQKGGSVCVRRTWSGPNNPPAGLYPLLQVRGSSESINKVYTWGTRQGLLYRLQQQMTRKTVPISETLRRIRGTGKVPSLGHLVKDLGRWLPRRAVEGWPRLDAPLNEQLAKIQINGRSNAGPPYHRNKAECLEDIVDNILPLVCEHIKAGTLNLLQKEQPELFLVEVKNKLDRYDSQDIESKTKTRPYVNVPAHFAFLFSILSQRFQEGLLLFHEKEGCANAYGFSSAEGGLEKMANWMWDVKEQEIKVICYGDDTRLVTRRNGRVYMVNPDFKQMDGSVDSQTVITTISYILSHLFKEDGVEGNGFWEEVAKLWKHMALTPRFILEGVQTYKKKSQDGLMTGVVGTTLFDTVKSIISWQAAIEYSSYGKLDILDCRSVETFMLDFCGLVVKPGTFVPVEVPPFEAMLPGDLLTDHKFLGIQIKMLDFCGEPCFVPTIPEEEMWEMLLCQKDDPWLKKRGIHEEQRLLFDRMRGLFLTFGFSNPTVTSAIHNVVNSLNPTVVLMQTNVKGGEKPNTILLQDFGYPDSSGFPSKEFCLSLYKDARDRKEFWIDLFPGLDKQFLQIRTEIKDLKLVTKESPRRGKMAYTELVEPEPLLKEHKDFSYIDTEKKPSFKVVEGNKRSAVRTVEGVLEKYLPNTGESILRTLRANGGLAYVGELRMKYQTSDSALEAFALKYGFTFTGFEPFDVVSLNPIETPDMRPQVEKVLRMETQKQNVDKGSASRREFIQKFSHGQDTVDVRCPSVWLDPNLKQCLSEVHLPPKQTLQLESVAVAMLSKLGWASKFITNSIDSKTQLVEIYWLGAPLSQPQVPPTQVIGKAHAVSRKIGAEGMSSLFINWYSQFLKSINRPIPWFVQQLDPLPMGIGSWAEEVEIEALEGDPIPDNIKFDQANKFMVASGVDSSLEEIVQAIAVEVLPDYISDEEAMIVIARELDLRLAAIRNAKSAPIPLNMGETTNVQLVNEYMALFQRNNEDGDVLSDLETLMKRMRMKGDSPFLQSLWDAVGLLKRSALQRKAVRDYEDRVSQVEALALLPQNLWTPEDRRSDRQLRNEISQDLHTISQWSDITPFHEMKVREISRRFIKATPIEAYAKVVDSTSCEGTSTVSLASTTLPVLKVEKQQARPIKKVVETIPGEADNYEPERVKEGRKVLGEINDYLGTVPTIYREQLLNEKRVFSSEQTPAEHHRFQSWLSKVNVDFRGRKSLKGLFHLSKVEARLLGGDIFHQRAPIMHNVAQDLHLGAGFAKQVRDRGGAPPLSDRRPRLGTCVPSKLLDGQPVLNLVVKSVSSDHSFDKNEYVRHFMQSVEEALKAPFKIFLVPDGIGSGLDRMPVRRIEGILRKCAQQENKVIFVVPRLDRE